MQNRLDAAVHNLGDFSRHFTPSVSDHWMKHSLALCRLESFGTQMADANGEFGCGPVAFAAMAGLRSEEISPFFPQSNARPWTNRREMEQAFNRFGWQFTKLEKAWPRIGMCMVHWRGPWTKSAYPPAQLQHTHWIAVIEDYVFDVNWRGWLPRENWEEIIVTDLLKRHPRADGWEPWTAYEIVL